MRNTTIAWPLLALLLLIPLFLAAQQLPGGSAFTITRNAGDGIQISFQLPDWELETVERGGETLSRVRIAGIPNLFIDEEETLPVFSTMIAIPYRGGVSLRLSESPRGVRDGVHLDFASTLATEQQSGRYTESLYPAASALISEPMVLRDFRVVTLNVHPFQYDRSKGELIVRENIDISLDFDNSSSVNEMEPPLSYSPAFEKIYQGLIINYQQMLGRDGLGYSHPLMLVIYGNYTAAAYLAKVDEYVGWKRQKGYIVNAVSTVTTGLNSTAIKDYIQTQYNNLTSRPDYIVLIGDAAGTITVPTNSSYDDYYYTKLAGGDELGDVIIGRISVSSTAELITYNRKLKFYERDIDPANASWLNNMLLVADTYSGISTIYANRYIHDISMAVNPLYNYTEIYTLSPSDASTNTAISNGVAFFNFRGWINMNGWDATDINNTNNINKPYHAVIITCATGSSGTGTSRTEAITRAGSDAMVKGGVTAIGMATAATHTPMNNCLDHGIFHAIYDLGMRDMGSALQFAKIYLNSVYSNSGQGQADQAIYFSKICNLMGDPSATVYVGIPSLFNVTAPAIIPTGASSMELTVKDPSNQPVAGASVALTNSDGQQALAFTDTDGLAYLEFSSSLSGSLTLTINKDDFKPQVQTISINTAGGLVFDGAEVSDGEGGNGDGEANSGETLDIKFSLKNTTSTTLTPTGVVSCSDEYVDLIDNRIEFDAIPPYSTVQSQYGVILQIAAACPDQHRFILEFVDESTAGNLRVSVPVIVSNGCLKLVSHTFIGSPGNYVHPGDTWPLNLTLSTSGSALLIGIEGTLSSLDSFFEVTDATGYWGNIAAGASAGNNTNTFTVKARSTCVDGMVIPLQLELFNSQGYTQSIPLTFTIGQTTVNDPLGQDAYGYFIFGMEDTGYDQRPTYNWIGITPAEGGSGTALTLTDPGDSGDEGDQVGAVSIQTVNLPFTFTFYGVEYTQASISANGFIAFGATQNSDWRNWRLPGAGGPSPMLAVFWDDLEMGTGSGVYTWYNSTLHYYIVEWYGLYSGKDSSTRETFQAILYDSSYYPTHTGDCQIKLQYKNFNNIDSTVSSYPFPYGNYATVGIEDHTGIVGLEYTFNNTYPTAAAPLTDASALFITTRPPIPNYPFVVVQQVLVQDPNANHHLEPGEAAQLSIRLGNRGLVDATGVSAVLSVSDPFVTITTSSANYGTVPAQGSALPQSNYVVQVASNCPGDHLIDFTLSITSDNGSWTAPFQLEVYAPRLEFSEITINDVSGDNDGILDPGETVVIAVNLNNAGQVASQAGTATFACNYTGITVSNGTVSFNEIVPGGFVSLSFGLPAATSVPVGSVLALDFNATAGSFTANRTEYTVVGLITETFETGNFSSMPWIQGSNPWVIDNSVHYNGVYSAKSGTTGNNGISSMEISRSVTSPGTLSFWSKVSSENNYDFLKFYINGTQMGSWSGSVEWAQASYTLNTGINLLKWVYSKDGGFTGGSDCAWVDDIIFPASTNPSSQYPAQNMTAVPSNQSGYLSWSAPLFGTPGYYKIFRNSAYLTSTPSLAFTDLAVTNGITYNYYVIAGYTDGDSDPTSTVSATPNLYPPTNLTATGADRMVILAWTAASGRGEQFSRQTEERDISGYRIYRDGTAITTVTGISHQDTGLNNGVTHTYYVTTIYADPAAESAPSNIVTVTPNIVTEVIIGAGTDSGSTSTACPINVYYQSLHGQSVYTAAELNALGVVGPINISQIGFNVTGLPTLAMPNYIIRMGHTSASNVASWISTGLTHVWTAASYQPTTTGWNMMALPTPFLWNGTDNIVIDTAFGVIGSWNSSGTTQYTTVTSGYRYGLSDSADQTNIFTGGSDSTYRPNLRLIIFPNLDMLLPPQNLSASTSHGYVQLDWDAPVSGTPNSYKIYRNGNILTSTPGTGYRDSAVTDGTTYQYYLTAVYDGAESPATQTVSATPNMYPPTNLVALPGNAVVDLNWTAAEGRETSDVFSAAGSKDRNISSYRIYRNGMPITTETGTSYRDTGLSNGVTYSYYVSTLYSNPAGESAPSNTVTSSPNLTFYAILGNGTSVTTGNQNGPINISNNSTHGQSVYTSAELNAAGVTGAVTIIGIGFDVVGAPNLPLPDFVVRLKHTTQTTAETWHTNENLVTAYTNAFYQPVAGDWNMLMFSTPYEWNGVDNLLIDTAFGMVGQNSQTGTLRYSSVAGGYCFAYSNNEDQTNVFTGGIVADRRYNLRIAYQTGLDAPVVAISRSGINSVISWPAVPNATGYQVWSATTPDGTYSLLTPTPVLTPTYTDTRNLPMAFYKVTAVRN